MTILTIIFVYIVFITMIKN